MSRPAPILQVERLNKHFVLGSGLWHRARTLQAVSDASFDVDPGASLGLVGESGCGKSTLARCVLRLIEPDSGRVRFDGEDLLSLRGPALQRARRGLQIVFQDPYASLNPRRTIGQTLAEPLQVHGLGDAAQVSERVAAALAEVGLPEDAAVRYPHEFSGGQRQRVGIARALILQPKFIVADEPVSALDVSVQAQVLKLLERLRESRGLSLLLVSHDLGVVRHVCDRIAVMYLGRIVEEGPVPALLDEPLHPYTRILRAASPVPDPTARFSLPRVQGEIPSAIDLPSGCAFHTRCPDAMPRCSIERPALAAAGSGRRVACFLHQ
jgi:peptide/nickel transport system ATP-binding protein